MAKKEKQRRPKHTPQRTCVACRQKFSKQEITRLVRTEEGVLVDPSGKLNGRGAYVCHQAACWDKVRRTTLLTQALRTPVSSAERDAIYQQRPIEQSR